MSFLKRLLDRHVLCTFAYIRRFGYGHIGRTALTLLRRHRGLTQFMMAINAHTSTLTTGVRLHGVLIHAGHPPGPSMATRLALSFWSGVFATSSSRRLRAAYMLVSPRFARRLHRRIRRFSAFFSLLSSSLSSSLLL